MQKHSLSKSLPPVKPGSNPMNPQNACNSSDVACESLVLPRDIRPRISADLLLSRLTLWITGLPCAGKTTLAKQLKQQLNNLGYSVIHLDGDNLRETLNADLGFSPDDRRENLRRVAHVAKLFNENGNIVIASFVSPSNHLRKMLRNIVGDLKLIYARCSLKTCEQRDTKGMYKKARMGLIKNFTGVSAGFEEPDEADIVVNTEKSGVTECAEHIIKELGI